MSKDNVELSIRKTVDFESHNSKNTEIDTKIIKQISVPIKPEASEERQE